MLHNKTDLDKSRKGALILKGLKDLEMPGSTCNLDEGSVLLFDVKKYEIATKKVTDCAWGIQPLIHSLAGRIYLICGQY